MSIDPGSCGIHCPWCKTLYQIPAQDGVDSYCATEIKCTRCGATITATVDSTGISVGLVKCVNSNVKKDKDGHAGDCTIYASLVNNMPTDGICTCGYGRRMVRLENWDHMYSDERKKIEFDDDATVSSRLDRFFSEKRKGKYE